MRAFFLPCFFFCRSRIICSLSACHSSSSCSFLAAGCSVAAGIFRYFLALMIRPFISLENKKKFGQSIGRCSRLIGEENSHEKKQLKNRKFLSSLRRRSIQHDEWLAIETVTDASKCQTQNGISKLNNRFEMLHYRRRRHSFEKKKKTFTHPTQTHWLISRTDFSFFYSKHIFNSMNQLTNNKISILFLVCWSWDHGIGPTSVIAIDPSSALWRPIAVDRAQRLWSPWWQSGKSMCRFPAMSQYFSPGIKNSNT